MKEIQINIKQLNRLYQSDMSLGTIADQLGISLSTLRNKLNVLGWIRIPKTRKIKLNLKKIQEFHKLGLTREEILKKLKICRGTLIQFEKEHKIYTENQSRIDAYKKGLKTLHERKQLGLKPELRHNWSRLDPYKEKIEALLKQGVPKSEIARRYHVCQATLYNFTILHGLNAPRIKKLDLKQNEIKSLFHEGKSLQTMAKTIECSTKLLDQTIKEMGLKRTLKDVKFNARLNNQEDTIKRMFALGISNKEIAKKLNVHPASIRRKIKQLNLIRCDKWYECKLDNFNQLLQMRTNGMTFKQIANYFGVQPATVLYQLKKLKNNEVISNA